MPASADGFRFDTDSQPTHDRIERWPARIALLNDFVRIPYANGSAFATQFLYREFRARGHEVTVIGPDAPHQHPDELPAHHITLPSLPLRVHPGVRLPLPSVSALSRLLRTGFDLVLGQTATELAQVGVLLRAVRRVPFLCVNTIHLPSVYNTLLPDRWLTHPLANAVFRDGLVPLMESHSAEVYNQTDGLIVLSRGLEQYWRSRGVTAPIYVIPRSIEPKIFDRAPAQDPFAPSAKRGGRVLCVCRHIREKALDRLIALFARHVASQLPYATLTLVGDGPEHESLRAQAVALGVGRRVFFTGEVPATELSSFYRNADVFAYTSLSETYGQVVSESLWCGLPVVAFEDQMGVSDQVEHERTGLLVAPGPDRRRADATFANELARLLQRVGHLRALGRTAQLETRRRVSPERILKLHYDAFAQARVHCRETVEALPQLSTSARGIRRWSLVHTALAGLGCLRAETTINRHACRQPGWGELEQSPRAYELDCSAE